MVSLPSPVEQARTAADGSVRQLVAHACPRLTRAERQVAEAVLLRPQRVVDLGIYELAHELGVGPAVISRFTRAVGLPGFRALRLALAQELGAEQALTAQLTSGAAGDDHPDGVAWRAAQAAMRDDIAALHRNLRAIDPASLTAAARLVAGAKQVITVGNNLSGAVGQRMVSMLRARGWRARAEAVPSDLTWPKDLAPGDVVVVISHRGEPVGIVAALPAIRAQGARLLAITNAPKSPLGRAADAVLATFLPGDAGDDAYAFDPVLPVQVGTMRALVAAAIATRGDMRP
jgi:DNA-binding MurR/RpiR family transcriptional regulator